MKSGYIEQIIFKLDAMIATFAQSVILGPKPTEKEREAIELLKDARLKFVEELEARGTSGWKL